ncbi:MAG: hypothetical protein HUJ75_05120 [Parasporobacterium sp.]|nr:hypothetical protein [Parasporobacterium sp.]
MARQGLIIGIDYTDDYCQACYYNRHHLRTESVSTRGSSLRYLIPVGMCYAPDRGEWLIGEEAVSYAKDNGVYLFTELLKNAVDGEKCTIDGRAYSYASLLAIFIRKLIELIQLHSAVMGVEFVAVNLRKVTSEIKDIFMEVFSILGIPAAKSKLLSCAESFAYFVLQEDPALWKRGALLIDFGKEGLFINRFTVDGPVKEPVINIEELNHSIELSVRDLESDVYIERMDRKLLDLYEEHRFDGKGSGVYFTGSGFSKLWFTQTLNKISEEQRAFRGNNIYVRGACMMGLMRSRNEKDPMILCKGRTRVNISVAAKQKENAVRVPLITAPVDWFDAEYTGDFILEDDRSIDFYLTSVVTGQHTSVTLDLENFPQRPEKTTRVTIQIKYRSAYECDIKIMDRGFGGIYPSSGAEVSQRLNLEEFD